MDVVDWMEDDFFPTIGCKFFVTLKRGRVPFASAEAMEAERLLLLEATMHDVYEQCVVSAGLAAGEPAAGTAPGSNVVHALICIQARQAEMMLRLQQQGKDIGKIREVARSYKNLMLPFRAMGRAVRSLCGHRGAVGDYLSAGLVKARILPRWRRRSVSTADDGAKTRHPDVSGRAINRSR